MFFIVEGRKKERSVEGVVGGIGAFSYESESQPNVYVSPHLFHFVEVEVKVSVSHFLFFLAFLLNLFLVKNISKILFWPLNFNKNLFFIIKL